MGTANFGIAGLDWQQRVNWDRLKKYRTERAREHMKKHGLGAVLCMYDENVRYLTGTLTPGWNRLKPGLRYALLCGDGAPVLFEQGDLGFQIERHSPWIPKENVRYSYAWIKGAAGPASQQQVKKFTDAILYEMKLHGVAGQKLGVDFIDINMISIFKDKKINWVDGMTPMMEARAVKNVDEQECMRIVGAIGDATHWECMKFLRPGITENHASENLSGDPLLDDLRALVEFAHAGSIAGAADRLFRTPSAITRQVQRLEAALGAELLDRSVKPPRLNSLGSKVLEQARDLLQRTEALKSLTSSDAEPHGLLRIGLAHALAEGTLIEPIQALTEKYPKVRLRLSSELTGELIHRLLAGELDVAAVLLPEGKTAPPPLLTNIIASDRMEIVQGAAGNYDQKDVVLVTHSANGS